jgi:hypothetical protein
MSTSGLAAEQQLQLVVQLQPSDTNDSEHVDRSTRLLLETLTEAPDFTDVRLLGDVPIPAGAKAGEAITIGVVALAVLPTLLPRFVDALQAWSLRWRDYRVRIKRQVGDQSLEVEYAPGNTSIEELNSLLSLIGSYGGRGSKRRQTPNP